MSLPSGVDQPRRTPSSKQRPRLPAPFPRDIRGGRVVGVVSELKAQVRRGSSGAQGWTPSPPIRPPFCPPLRPHVEQSAAADSASTGTGPTPTTNWPPRWTHRMRKGGVRRQACVADTSGPTCAGLANTGSDGSLGDSPALMLAEHSPPTALAWPSLSGGSHAACRTPTNPCARARARRRRVWCRPGGVDGATGWLSSTLDDEISSTAGPSDPRHPVGRPTD
jgi:hypothetical protein